jgi:hypothetical protein
LLLKFHEIPIVGEIPWNPNVCWLNFHSTTIFHGWPINFFGPSMSHRGSPGSLRQFPIHGAEKGGQRQISMVIRTAENILILPWMGIDLIYIYRYINISICIYRYINISILGFTYWDPRIHYIYISG